MDPFQKKRKKRENIDKVDGREFLLDMRENVKEKKRRKIEKNRKERAKVLEKKSAELLELSSSKTWADFSRKSKASWASKLG